MARNPSSVSSNNDTAGFLVDPRFVDLKPLGFGGSGVVFSAIDSDCDKAVAIKKLAFHDKKSCKYALREIKIMRRLKHENVVTVYEILGPNGYQIAGHSSNIPLNELTSLYLVQELLDTDLQQLIQAQVLTEEHVCLFLYQLIRGLKYIHSANVVHRDLKPSNLLINIEDLSLKIGDFGLARIVDMEYSHKGYLTDGVGTCWYRSPELIISPRDYTKAIDMWSVGCIFAEMLTGKPLFSGGNEMDQIGRILDVTHLNDNEWNKLTQVLPISVLSIRSRSPKTALKSKFKDLSEDALDLLGSLLLFNPDRRISAEDALDHTFLAEYRCPDDEPIALRSFHVENEVDELSPKTLRRMLGTEVTEPVIPCGRTCDMNKITDAMATDHVLAKNMENVSRSSSSESLSDKVDNKYSDITQLIQMSEKLSFLDNSYPSPKELTLQVIVSLPDEENKKEQLSPKEEKTGHRSASKNSCQTNSLQTREEKRQVDNEISLMPIRQTEASAVRKDLKISVTKDNDNQLDRAVTSSSSLYTENATNFLNANPVLSQEEKLNENSHKVSKNLGSHKKSTNQRQKDRLNEEKRAESPREIPQKGEKNRPRNEYDKNTDTWGKSKEKTRGESQKEEKMKRNKIDKNRESSEISQDFDSMYRLPTEHLLHRRARRGDDRSSSRLESQLRIHEHRNSQLKLAEFERDRCIGAMGGCNLPPPGLTTSQEDIPALYAEHRSRSSSGSSETDTNYSDFPRRSEH